MTAPFTSKADFYEGSPIWEPPEPPEPDGPPTLTALNPSTYPALDGEVIVDIVGTNFYPGLGVCINGMHQGGAYTYVSSTLIQAPISGAVWGYVTLQIGVNEVDGSVSLSNELPFTLT